ncbi:MAG: RNA polymerase sigma-70 factor [Phycisphaerae bacterium]|nr:RNA polymerase sigma-70 factor [Gemmatimonadaceae bacterium]
MNPLRGPSAPSDVGNDVVDRIRDGDVAAFEQLFRSSHASLLAFATSYLRDPARGEELVQELFLELWTKRAQWNVTGNVRSYLFAAVRHRALNTRRRDLLELDWIESEGIESIGTLHATPPLAGEESERAELHDQVHRAIELLPERCRLVMQLRWRDGLAYAEIAQVMGISLKGVENQLGRGLRALRERLLRT